MRDIYLHYAEVCRRGFDFGIDHLDRNGIDYSFLGLVDADTIVERHYFEKLITEFQKNRKLGLVSGGLFQRRKGRLVFERTDKNSPRGTGRLWRKACYLQTGGYLASLAPPDVISNAKAKLLGYEIRQFQSIVAIQLRVTSSAEGVWKGLTKKGKSWHYLNAHPTLVLMNVIHFTTEKPYYGGLAFFLGYFAAFLRRDPKINDEDIKRYFWKQRPLEVVENALNKGCL